MKRRHWLPAIVGGLGLVGVFLMPRGASGPFEVEPRRNGGYPGGYVLYSKRAERPAYSGGAKRLYYMMLKPTDRDILVLDRRELLDHYRVGPEHLARVPSGWLSAYRARRE